MNGNNDQDANVNSDSGNLPDVKQTSESNADSSLDAAQKKSPEEKAARKRVTVTGVAALAIIMLVLAFLGGGVWFVWQEKQKLEQQTVLLQTQITQTREEFAQLKQAQQQLATANVERDAASSEYEAALSERLRAAEQRLQAQHKRLQSLSTTSREDWLLAEAEYLLRLANQRVLIERSPRSADALLSEADNILMNLADPDLFSLRQAIANDLAQLRLVEEIDREGLYFSLNALLEQIDKLSLHPTRTEVMGVNEEETTPAGHTDAATTESTGEKSAWKRMVATVAETFSFMGDFIKLRDHDERPPPLLPPDAAAYLQQNLRFKLERAQLALLREEQEIYSSSLQEVVDWLQRYYPKSPGTESFIKQVYKLREKNIVQQLPDITHSLELLHAYIEDLHKLDGVKAPTKDNKQSDPAQGGAL